MTIPDKIIIRNEIQNDFREVENLTREAFWNVYEPGCTEHYLLHQMRQSPDFISELDFVAVSNDGQIVGNVVCARSHIERDSGERRTVVTLGPISVLPDYQHSGIGRRLIEHTVNAARRMGYTAILLCGDPVLYSGYGFKPAGKYAIRTSENKISPFLHIYPLKVCDMHTLAGRYFESRVYEMDLRQVEAFDKNFPPKEKIKDTPTQLRFKKLLSL